MILSLTRCTNKQQNHIRSEHQTTNQISCIVSHRNIFIMFIHTVYEGKFDWILMSLPPLYTNVTCNTTVLDVLLLLLLIACDEGTYGQECKGICGNCLEGKSCSHTNGTCLNECETGYFGDLCKTGKYIYTMKMFLFFFSICNLNIVEYTSKANHNA